MLIVLSLMPHHTRTTQRDYALNNRDGGRGARVGLGGGGRGSTRTAKTHTHPAFVGTLDEVCSVILCLFVSV